MLCLSKSRECRDFSVVVSMLNKFLYFYIKTDFMQREEIIKILKDIKVNYEGETKNYCWAFCNNTVKAINIKGRENNRLYSLLLS